MSHNRLGREKSPYLLQHKDNPIAWMPWGAEAFARAARENKPVFLSVGYSTCHWCHVMAHESFEDGEVAEVLNAGFVCIKVDREERPDVDHVYMTALQTLSGGGGWPMSVWLTADAKPFFAGTYYPKIRFLQLLRRIVEVWAEEPGQLRADSERLLEVVQKSEARTSRDAGPEFTIGGARDILRSYIPHFAEHFDPLHGGFGGAPKFPQTMNLRVLMRQDPGGADSDARLMVVKTLENMSRGGIYDHLMGGFHRYSVDEEWLVPHFEKMLYDQAMIVSTLVEANQLYGGHELERVARETLDYVLREMTHPLGGFYSAQDADSLDPVTGHSEEGYFCTYTYEELKVALTDPELKAIESLYGVSPAGNFEGRNILHLQAGHDGREKVEPAVASALEKLKQIRTSRPPPHLDDKIITAWNGWMIAALAQAGRAFGEPKYLAAARRALDFVREKLWNGDRLFRYWRDGVAEAPGQAEDFAAIIHAALELQQAKADSGLAAWTLELQKALDEKYWSAEQGLYLSNDGVGTQLPLRLADAYDGVTPSANSMAAFNLARLYLLTADAGFDDHFQAIAGALINKWRSHPSGLAFLALAIDFYVGKPKVAVCAGGGWVDEFHRSENSRFHPRRLWATPAGGWPVAADKGSDSAVYICEVGACLPPAQTLAQAAKTFLE